jgi:hypothetical protein
MTHASHLERNLLLELVQEIPANDAHTTTHGQGRH